MADRAQPREVVRHVCLEGRGSYTARRQDVMPFQLVTPSREASMKETRVLPISLPFATKSWNGTKVLSGSRKYKVRKPTSAGIWGP